MTGIQELLEHLSSLKKEFLSYFPNFLLDAMLIRSPFTVDASSVLDDIHDEFVDLISDSTAKDAYEATFPSQVLVKKWLNLILLFSTRVVKSLLVFPRSYV